MAKKYEFHVSAVLKYFITLLAKYSDRVIRGGLFKWGGATTTHASHEIQETSSFRHVLFYEFTKCLIVRFQIRLQC